MTNFDVAFNSGNIAFWPMVEDADGNLYAGQYDVGDPKVSRQKVWKSTDDGATWSDISHGTWTAGDHIHGLTIDVSNGWLYAATGDENGTDGLWRSKLKDGSDWVIKTSDSYQYIPIVAAGGFIYLADDQRDGQVTRLTDDGTTAVVTPTVVLDTGFDHNCYYLAEDLQGRLWAYFPPMNSVDTDIYGFVYISDDGVTWERLMTHPPMTYAEWFAGDETSHWTFHTGTTQFHVKFNGNFVPLSPAKGSVKISVSD